MDISKEQFDKLRSEGFSTDQIATFSTRLGGTSQKQPSSISMSDRMKQTEGEISNRGNYFLNLEKNWQSPNPIMKTVAGLQTLGAPMAMLEQSIAGPALQMQRGNFNPKQLASEAMEGFLGKQNQYGDLLRSVGAPRGVPEVAGFLTSLSPVAAISKLNKTFGALTKMSDKGILKAGNALMNAGTEAESFAGAKLNDAFKTVDAIPVDPNNALNVLSQLPKQLFAKVEEIIGKPIDPNNLTVGAVRQIKQIVGKYKPSMWGKDARGLAENIEAEDIGKAYGGLKNLIGSSVDKNVGGEAAKHLMSLEDSFSEVAHASDYIKKAIVDPTLLKATRAGKVAGKLIEEGDVSGREALNVLKRAGGHARKNINKAVSAMEKFNRWKAVTGGLEHAMGAGLYGGVAGSLGGMMLGKMLKNRGE